VNRRQLMEGSAAVLCMPSIVRAEAQTMPKIVPHGDLGGNMQANIDPAVVHIYQTWHDTVRNRDLAGTVALYAEGAILETPLALAVYPDRQSGVLVGRATIRQFFEDSARKFSNDFAQLFRTDTFFVNGKQLTWEYPRQAPKGDQVDLMEMMEIDNGLISSHRVYWGWYGIRLLAAAMPKKPAAGP
jgi:steroid Delta-isomerase